MSGKDGSVSEKFLKENRVLCEVVKNELNCKKFPGASECRAHGAVTTPRSWDAFFSLKN